MDLPFHPRIVHIPIALAVLMPALAAGILFAWSRGWLLWRGWLIAVALQATLVVAGIAAMRTGEGDEERVEKVVSEQVIEAHEEAAEVFVWVAAVTLALMVAAVMLRRSRAARVVAGLSVAGTLAVLWLGYRTGQAGGELVYRHGAASAWAPGQGDLPAVGPVAEDGDEDDD